MAAAQQALGDHSRAEALHREAIALQRTFRSDDDPNVLRSWSGLAAALHGLGEAFERVGEARLLGSLVRNGCWSRNEYRRRCNDDQ